jgi:hypothetical protein
MDRGRGKDPKPRYEAILAPAVTMQESQTARLRSWGLSR